MFTRFLPTCFLGLSLVAPAFAADLPARTAPPAFVPPLPVFSWTGAYVGGQIGYAFGRDSVYAPGVFPSTAYQPRGVAGGAHIGYGFQSNQFVLGVEADVNGSSYSASGTNPFNGATLGSRIPVDGSIRGRVGVAFDRVLFYATGGAALASIRDTYSDAAGFSAINRTRVGYTVGGGIDYAISNNWLFDLQYRYTDYGHFSDYPGTVVSPRIHDATDNRVQAGVSYKFDSIVPLPPVTARY